MSELINKIIEDIPITSDMMSEREIRALLYQLESVLDEGIEGDIVELGCNIGTTSIFIRRMLDEKNSNKNYYVYDSFEGLPAKNMEDGDTCFAEGGLLCQREWFEDNFRIHNLRLPVINKYWFKDIPNEALPDKICFAFFDGDFYSSILDSFEIIYDSLVKDARVVIDDFGDPRLPGARQACLDFLADKPENPISLPDYGYGAVVVYEDKPKIVTNDIWTNNLEGLSNSNRDLSLCLAIMVKDEEERIAVTLKSAIDHVDCVYVLDTGSTDNTVNIIVDICKEYNKPTVIFYSDFVDYAKSRNILLDRINKDGFSDYILMMDANDELVGGGKLKDKILENPADIYIMKRDLSSKKYNIVFMGEVLLASKKYLAYQNKIHEIITGGIVREIINEVSLFQDRDFDDEKTRIRRKREVDILRRQHYLSPSDSKCLMQLVIALYSSNRSADIIACTDDYIQRRIDLSYSFIILHHRALAAENLGYNHHDVVSMYTRAWESVSKTSIRVEPLIDLSRIYLALEDYNSAYMYIREACRHDIPSTMYCEDALFLIDKRKYNYFRWNYYYISSYMLGKYEESRKALQVCLDSEYASDYDAEQLLLFEKTEAT